MWMPRSPSGACAPHRVGDGGAHVAALGDITGVAEAVHQLRPGLRDAADVPAELGRLAGEAVAGQGRQYEWNASSAWPPCAVGSVSGPTVSSSSITEPGQPCVMISGNASSCDERTWMKWMSTPSISVMNWGNAFNLASSLPSRSRWPSSARAPGSSPAARPGASATVSCSGQRVACYAPAEIVEFRLRDIGLERADLGAHFDGSHQRLPWSLDGPTVLGRNSKRNCCYEWVNGIRTRHPVSSRATSGRSR